MQVLLFMLCVELDSAIFVHASESVLPVAFSYTPSTLIDALNADHLKTFVAAMC